MAEKKQKKVENEIVRTLSAGESITLRDVESGSKAWLPIVVDGEYDLEIVKVDKGIIDNIPEGKYICDNLIYSIPLEKGGLNITWLIELKGTKLNKEVNHAIGQIMDTIGYLLDNQKYPASAKYLKKRDLVLGLIVGSPDKTLPAFMKSDVKQLCQRLLKQSLRSSEVKDMYTLVFSIQPRKGKRACCVGNAPYTITCFNSRGCEIVFPTMFTDIVLNNYT